MGLEGEGGEGPRGADGGEGGADGGRWNALGIPSGTKKKKKIILYISPSILFSSFPGLHN